MFEMTYLIYALLQNLTIQTQGRCAHMFGFFQRSENQGLYLWMILCHWEQQKTFVNLISQTEIQNTQHIYQTTNCDVYSSY